MFTPGIFPWWMSKQHTYKVYIIIILLHTDFPIDFSLHCSRRLRPVPDYPPSNSLLYVATHLSHQQPSDSCAKQTVAFIVWPLTSPLLRFCFGARNQQILLRIIMAYSFLLLVLTCLAVIQSVIAYNILILSPITTPSHTNILKPLVMALAETDIIVVVVAKLLSIALN